MYDHKTRRHFPVTMTAMLYLHHDRTTIIDTQVLLTSPCLNSQSCYNKALWHQQSSSGLNNNAVSLTFVFLVLQDNIFFRVLIDFGKDFKIKRFPLYF